MSLTWKKPPKTAKMQGEPRPYNRSIWQAIADQLRARPNRWALVREYASPDSAATAASLLRNGRLKIDPQHLEIAVDGSDLYLRWVGLDESDSQGASST